MKKVSILAILILGLALCACGGKKGKAKNAGDEGDTDSDATQASAMEPEANTGPTEYPEPPKNTAERAPAQYQLSVKKAYVLPLSKDGSCFDECSKEIKGLYVENLPNLAGEQFGSAANAMTTAVGAKGGLESLPDIYVNINCGYGQEFTTHKTSAQNQLTARWRGASETMKLDKNDQCAVSVWDADDDNQDELIGDTVVNLTKMANNGTVTLTSEENDFGQVFMVELYLEQEGAPISSGGGSSSSGGSGSGGGGGSSGGGSSAQPQPADPSGAAVYKVEIIKANIAEKKKDGQPWDAKIPFVGKAEDVASDPFVKAYINGYQSENPFMETSAGANNNYQEWRKTGEAKLKPGDKIHFMVWDKDKVDHDLVGECISDPVGAIPSGQEVVLKGCGQVEFLTFKVTRK